jgi:hypothetical protein
MHILQAVDRVQDIKIKSRKTILSGACVVEITNKSERRTFEYTVSHSYDSSTNITTLSFAFPNLIAESYYSIVVKDDNGEIYRGMVYVTDQTDFDKYEVGKGDYIVEQTLDNDFIVIGDESGGVTPSPSDVTLCYDTSDMDALTSAFKICDLYCVTIDEVNYDDWYLPSTEEAKEIYPYISVLNNSATRFGYDPYYLPEVTSTPSGPSQTNQYYWTSTENVNSPTFAFVYQKWIYLSPIANLLKDIPENCYLSEVNCGGTYYRTKKARVRPVRFEAGVEGGFSGNLGEKGYGGIIAGSYTLNGVDGALIVSPTEPKPADGYTQWSDLGQATTGVISETDGQANTIAALALGA